MKFKALVTKRMRVYLKESRAPLQTVFHAAPVIDGTRLMNPGFISVGEWVEVEHSYVSGACSDEGVGVVMAFDDKGADVRCHEYYIYCHYTFLRNLTLPQPPILLGMSWMAAWNCMLVSFGL